MSMTFTKLFSSITESTIWIEDDPTRIVWIAMLAMADRKGRVWGSIPGLANRARVSVENCEAALERFRQPDKYSRTYTEECEGRRIKDIEGGWLLINYEKYRDIRDDETVRESKRAYMERRRKEDSKRSKKVDLVERGGTPLIQEEEEASSSLKEKKRKAAPLPGENQDEVPPPAKSRRFVPPSIEEWRDYGKTLNPPMPEGEIESTFNYYTAKGWTVGKSPMRDWKAAMRTCWLNWKKKTQDGRQTSGNGYRSPDMFVTVNPNSNDRLPAHCMEDNLADLLRAKMFGPKPGEADDGEDEEDRAYGPPAADSEIF